MIMNKSIKSGIKLYLAIREFCSTLALNLWVSKKWVINFFW